MSSVDQIEGPYVEIAQEWPKWNSKPAARVYCPSEPTGLQIWVGLDKHFAAHDGRTPQGHRVAAAVHLAAARWLEESE